MLNAVPCLTISQEIEVLNTIQNDSYSSWELIERLDLSGSGVALGFFLTELEKLNLVKILSGRIFWKKESTMISMPSIEQELVAA